MRPIDADALDIMEYREEFPNGAEDRGWNAAVRMINDYIQNASTLSYKDLVPQGEWMSLYEYALELGVTDEEALEDYKKDKWRYICKDCKEMVKGQHNFCPNCGARMKGGE